MKTFTGYMTIEDTFPPRIFLKQEDGYSIELLGRLVEAIYNYGNEVILRYRTAREGGEWGTITELKGEAEFKCEAFIAYDDDIEYRTEFRVGGHDLVDKLVERHKWGRTRLNLEIEW